MVGKERLTLYIRKSGTLYLLSLIMLFLLIGMLTTMKPAYRISSQFITQWTENIESSTFLHLFGMENRAFKQAYPEQHHLPKLSTVLLQLATNVKPNDFSTLLSLELPGFMTSENKIIVAGEGTNYSNLSYESSPPLEAVLKEREAIAIDEEDEEEQTPESKHFGSTGDRKVVYIYNTHNRESFLPHLPGVDDPNQAHHREVNITKVSEHLAKRLEANGIGTMIDKTDHMAVLNDRGWHYSQSYQASREVVAEAMANHRDIQYIFDIHRDSVKRSITTLEMDGVAYAKVLFVVGAEFASYEKNLALATTLNRLINEKYPGLSRGVITKEGPGSDGVYNQDLSENALLIEFGGHENSLDELYRTADIVADIFSEFYWAAEKVDAKP